MAKRQNSKHLYLIVIIIIIIIIIRIRIVAIRIVIITLCLHCVAAPCAAHRFHIIITRSLFGMAPFYLVTDCQLCDKGHRQLRSADSKT